MSPRVAIYARVSTTNHGQDVNLQTRDLEQFAQARGWLLVDSYLDIGISGAKDKRPELDRLMADAKRRKFDVVLVWAGMRNAKAKGTRIGRPRANVDAGQIAQLRAQGLSWKKIAKATLLGVRTH